LSGCLMYCGVTVRPSEKLSEGANIKPGSKSLFFGSPPYFYFRFRLYGHRDGRFCRTVGQTLLCWASCCERKQTHSRLSPAMPVSVLRGISKLNIKIHVKAAFYRQNSLLFLVENKLSLVIADRSWHSVSQKQRDLFRCFDAEITPV